MSPRQPIRRPPRSDAEVDAGAEPTPAEARAAVERWRRAVDAGGAALLDALPLGPNA